MLFLVIVIVIITIIHTNKRTTLVKVYAVKLFFFIHLFLCVLYYANLVMISVSWQVGQVAIYISNSRGAGRRC